MLAKLDENQVAYYFDPVCPWTWKTSRWLVEAATNLSFAVQWRPFSLTILNNGSIPEEYAVAMKVSSRVLRVITQMTLAQRNDEVFDLYNALGEAWFEGSAQISRDTVEAVLTKLNLDRYRHALDDDTIDLELLEIHSYAHKLAGEGTGSPVLELSDGVGAYGPILTDVPKGEEAGKLFGAVRHLVLDSRFTELKRHR